MVLAGAAIMALMLIAAGNVILRIFGGSYRGTYELVGFFGALTIAFALGYSQIRKDHVLIDLVSSHYPPKWKRIVNGVSHFITMIFTGIAAREILIWGMTLQRTGELSETLKIIYYPFVYCVSLGFAVMSLTLLADFIGTLVKQEDS